MREDTAVIVALAGALADPLQDADAATRERMIADFLAQYRAWILRERGMADDPTLWAERHAILLHLMLGGSTLGEAIGILARFAEPIWGASTRFDVIDEGKTMALVLDEPHEDGVEGLISSLWLLSSNIGQLEFLAGRRLDSVAGHVRDRPSIPAGVERFLFGRPLEYRAERSAIRISKLDAQRPVVASPSLVPSFLKAYMRLTVNSERPHDLAPIVADLVRRRLVEERRDGDMAAIAGALGMSTATLRRRLDAEGCTFRDVRAVAVDRLAKTWLRETDWTIERIAERAGYSDAFALRRAFGRANGRSPLAYRAAHRPEKADRSAGGDALVDADAGAVIPARRR